MLFQRFGIARISELSSILYDFFSRILIDKPLMFLLPLFALTKISAFGIHHDQLATPQNVLVFGW